VEQEEDQCAAQSYLITPMLYLGEPPSDVTTVPVELAEDALHVIGAGGVALLPRNRWDLASDVLELLGESKAWRLSELLWAKHTVRVVTEGLTTDELDAGLRGVTTPTGNGGVLCEKCGYFEATALRELNKPRALPHCPLSCVSRRWVAGTSRRGPGVGKPFSWAETGAPAARARVYAVRPSLASIFHLTLDLGPRHGA